MLSACWLQAMKYMQVLRDERSGKRLTVEVIDESEDPLDSDVRAAVRPLHNYM